MSFLNLEQRVILVAGGSGGIGSEIVRVLAESGASLVVADINAELAQEVAADLAEQGTPALGHGVDVSSDASVDTLYSAIHARFGALYGVVNAIGVVGVGSALECSLGEYQRQIDINCFGAVRLARKFIEYARTSITTEEDTVNGSLVYISSIAAELAIPERDPYCVSKAAGQLFHLRKRGKTVRSGYTDRRFLNFL